MKVTLLIGAFVGMAVGAIALISKADHADAGPPTSSGSSVAAIPAIKGAVTDLAAAKQIENVAITFVVLDESILDLRGSGTRDWPGTQPLLPPSSPSSAVPRRSAAGSLYVNPTVIATMVKQATAAMLSVATVHSDSTWWIKGAIETQSGQGFQVPGAGAYPTLFYVESQSPTRAVVTTRAVEWQHQLYQIANHSFRSHGITNQAIWTLTLIKVPSGRWKVDSTEFGFVPGYGP